MNVGMPSDVNQTDQSTPVPPPPPPDTTANSNNNNNKPATTTRTAIVVAAASSPSGCEIEDAQLNEDHDGGDIHYTLVELEAAPRINPEETLIHFMKSNVGAGMLSLPLAFVSGGLICSVFVFWVIFFLCGYCMHLLIEVYEHHRSLLFRLKLDYGDVVRFSIEASSVPGSRLAKFAKYVVDFFIISSQFGICAVYFVFVPVHVKELLSYYWPQYFDFSLYIYIILMYCMVCPLVCIRSLKKLAPLSLASNIMMIIALTIILQYIVRNSLPLRTIPLFPARTADFIFFLSTCVYSFEGIGFVLPLVQRTKYPDFFAQTFGVLNTGFSLIAILFFAMGFYGMLSFGSDAKSSIALNVPSELIVYQLTKLMIAIAVFLTYPLQFFLPCSIMWPRIRRTFLCSIPESNKVMLEYAWRIVMSLLIAIAAIVVPNIGMIIALIGAFCCTCLALIFPPILHMITFWTRQDEVRFGKYNYKLVLNAICLTVGLVVFCMGTFTSLQKIFYCFGGGNTYNPICKE